MACILGSALKNLSDENDVSAMDLCY